MITLLKDGTDDLAIAELALKVNGVEVFRKYFGDTRASSSWQGYIAAPPTFSFVIPHDELVSRFESIVGDSLHGTGAHWQETLRPVSITKIPIKKTDKYEQLHINLELAAEKYDVGVNIGIGFDLQVYMTSDQDGSKPVLNLVRPKRYLERVVQPAP